MPSKNLFKNPNEFSIYIETIASSEGINYYQALINFCEENDVDYEVVAKNISVPLKQKIASEFADIGLLQKTATLDE